MSGHHCMLTFYFINDLLNCAKKDAIITVLQIEHIVLKEFLWQQQLLV